MTHGDYWEHHEVVAAIQEALAVTRDERSSVMSPGRGGS